MRRAHRTTPASRRSRRSWPKSPSDEGALKWHATIRPRETGLWICPAHGYSSGTHLCELLAELSGRKAATERPGVHPVFLVLAALDAGVRGTAQRLRTPRRATPERRRHGPDLSELLDSYLTPEPFQALAERSRTKLPWRVCREFVEWAVPGSNRGPLACKALICSRARPRERRCRAGHGHRRPSRAGGAVADDSSPAGPAGDPADACRAEVLRQARRGSAGHCRASGEVACSSKRLAGLRDVRASQRAESRLIEGQLRRRGWPVASCCGRVVEVRVSRSGLAVLRSVTSCTHSLVALPARVDHRAEPSWGARFLAARLHPLAPREGEEFDCRVRREVVL